MKATVMYVFADERDSSLASVVGLRIDEIDARTRMLLINYLNEIA
jgi:hypothetical protein